MTREYTDPYATPLSNVSGVDGPEYCEVKVFSLKGRLGRVRYLAYSTAMLLIVWLGGGLLASVMIPMMVSLGDGAMKMVLGILLGVMYGFPVVAMFVLAVRRLNDFGATGWLSLLFLVPIVNVLFGIALWFIPGSQGGNRYGAPTPPNGGGVTVLAVLMPVVLLVFIGIIAVVSIPAYNQYVERAAQMQRR